MAKGNMLLGTVRGSIGDVTFTRTNGAQISKAKSTSPRNPRTSKQIYQRMFFATIAKAQSAMKAIVDHSFEQVQHGSKSLQYFSKRNIALMRQTATFSDSLQTWVAPGMGFVPPKANSFTWNPYRISEGSLLHLDVPQDYRGNLSAIESKLLAPWFTKLPANYTPESKLSQISEMLKRNACKVGDYLTLCMITAKDADIAQGAGVFYNCAFHFIRFKVCSYLANDNVEKLVFIPSNVDGDNYQFPDKFQFASGDPNLPALDDECFVNPFSETAEGQTTFYSALSFNQNLLLEVIYTATESGIGEVDYVHTFDNPVAADDSILAATWIHSRPKANGVILVSTQDMILADQSGDAYEFNLGLIDAYDEWSELVKQVGDNTYILQGGNASEGA